MAGDEILALLMFAGMIGFLFLGFPVAFSLTFTGLFFGAIAVALGFLRADFLDILPLRIWGTMTIAYAVSYALGGYVLSFVFARTGSYRLLFAIGAAALLLAWVIDASGGRRRSSGSSSTPRSTTRCGSRGASISPGTGASTTPTRRRRFGRRACRCRNSSSVSAAFSNIRPGSRSGPTNWNSARRTTAPATSCACRS